MYTSVYHARRQGKHAIQPTREQAPQRPGTYQATLQPTDATGNASSPRAIFAAIGEDDLADPLSGTARDEAGPRYAEAASRQAAFAVLAHATPVGGHQTGTKARPGEVLTD